MKNFVTGIFCTCLLASAWASPGWAQDQPGGDGATPQQQAPAPPATPQNPPPQTPAEEPQEQAPSQMPKTPPPLPKFPDVRQPGETGWFVGANAWFPAGHPIFNKGEASSFTNPSNISYPGKPKFAESIEFGVAAGLHNLVHVSLFQDKVAGSFTTSRDITLLSQTYPNGTLVDTSYNLQDAKISFEYLTWPYPVESRKFRLKTLWQVQYVRFRSGFDAPVLSNATSTDYTAANDKWFIAPTLGLGTYYYSSRNFRLEANASGFTIPHRWQIWDADASANFRVGHLEIRVGGRAFHFRTSPKQDFYGGGTLYAPFVGLRWYSD